MKRIAIFSMALALSLSSCASSRGNPSGDPVNTNCVMMPDETVDPDVTAMYKGMKVGFCCQDCVEEWNKLSDAEKDAKLKK